MAAEDVLHDLGAISMIGSDSQAMGRIGETIIRTWQTAHVMKQRRGVAARRRRGRQPAGPPLRRQVHDRAGGDARPGRRDRLGRAGQAGRPGAVGAGVLRRPAARRAQGRRDRVGADGRRQRVDPDPAAAAAAADVRRVRRAAGPARRALRRPRRARGRAGRPLGQRAAAGRRPRTCPACPRPTCRRTTRCRAIDVDPETFAVRVDGELIEPRARPPSCRWPSATSCSDAR